MTTEGIVLGNNKTMRTFCKKDVPLRGLLAFLSSVQLTTRMTYVVSRCTRSAFENL